MKGTFSCKSVYDGMRPSNYFTTWALDPKWFADNERFPDPSELFVIPDHYIFRMLVSQGYSLDQLDIDINKKSGRKPRPKEVWKIFSNNYYLFRGTPSEMWLNYSFEKVFGISKPLNSENGEYYFDLLQEKLNQSDFLPRALFEKFNIELLATTDSAISDLKYHYKINNSAWRGRVIPTYRPDSVVDPEHSNSKIIFKS